MLFRSGDPLFFLAGGPGQSALDIAAMINVGFRKVRADRDLVLIDQRGTGRSSPLDCIATDLDPFATLSDAATTELVRACIAGLGDNLHHFNTDNSAHDIDRLRRALGYGRINFYGGSYGTRLGLVFLRHYPGSARAAILDSVGPLQVPIGAFGQSSARAFRLLLDECAADAGCAAAFPDLERTFDDLVQRLRAQPVTATITHPTLGTDTTLNLDYRLLINNLRLMLYSTRTRRLVPLVIEQTAAGNYAPLIGVMAQALETADQISVGLNLNIICNEDFPRMSTEDLTADADNDFGRDTSHHLWQLACPIWPRYDTAPGYAQAVQADVPVLLVSGEMDPVTPPGNAEIAGEALAQSRHVVVPRGAHTTTFHSCAADIVADFLEEPANLRSLDTDCVTETPGTRFMLSLNDGG